MSEGKWVEVTLTVATDLRRGETPEFIAEQVADLLVHEHNYRLVGSPSFEVGQEWAPEKRTSSE